MGRLKVYIYIYFCSDEELSGFSHVRLSAHVYKCVDRRNYKTRRDKIGHFILISRYNCKLWINDDMCIHIFIALPPALHYLKINVEYIYKSSWAHIGVCAHKCIFNYLGRILWLRKPNYCINSTSLFNCFYSHFILLAYYYSLC